jgi:hypothetical protein
MQSERAVQAGAALEEVDAATQRIAEAIRAMNESATHQGRAAAGIAEATAEIASMTDHTRDSMERMRGAMDDLVELAGSLLRKISTFQVERRAPLGGGSGEVTGSLAPLPPADALEEITVPMPRLSSPAWASLGATTPHSPLPLNPAHPSQPLAGAARLVPVPSGPLGSGPLGSGPLGAGPSGPLGPLARSGATGPINPSDSSEPSADAGPGAHELPAREGEPRPFYLPQEP